jgi:hypothetical protein
METLEQKAKRLGYVKSTSTESLEQKAARLGYAKPEPSYLEGIGQAFTSAASDAYTNLSNFSKIPVKDIFSNTPEQNKGILQPLAQTPLDVLSIAGRPIGKAIEPVANAIGQGIMSGAKAVEPYTPNFISKPVEAGAKATGQFFTDLTTQQENPFGYTGNLWQSLLDASNVVGAGALAKRVASVAKATAKGAGNLTTKGLGVIGASLPEGKQVAANILNRELKLPKITGANKFKELANETAGDYLVKKGIYGDPENIMTQLADDWKSSYQAKKETLATLPDQYTFQPVRTMLDDLVKYDSEISTPGAPSKFSAKINELNEKAKTRGLNLSEMDDVQYLHQNTTKLGYNKLINPKQVERATELDKAVRNFIDDKATSQGFSNFRELNKNTQLSRFLGDQIEKKLIGEESNNFFGLTDNIFLGASMIDPSALAGLATKKILGSGAVMGGAARFLGGEGAGKIMPKVSQGTPALLGPASKAKNDFLVAPKGSKVGQFEPIGQTKMILPQSKSVKEFPYNETIPQKGQMASALDVENSTKIDNAYKLIYGEEAVNTLARQAKKDELFGNNPLSVVDEKGNFSWETGRVADELATLNKTFKDDVINKNKALLNEFNKSKAQGDDVLTALSLEGIVPNVTVRPNKSLITFSQDAIETIDSAIGGKVKLLGELKGNKIDLEDVGLDAIENTKKNQDIVSDFVNSNVNRNLTLDEAVSMLKKVQDDSKLTSFYNELKAQILSQLDRGQKKTLTEILALQQGKKFIETVNTNKISAPKDFAGLSNKVVEDNTGSRFFEDIEKLSPKQKENILKGRDEDEVARLYEEHLSNGVKPKGTLGLLFSKMNKK